MLHYQNGIGETWSEQARDCRALLKRKVVILVDTSQNIALLISAPYLTLQA